MYFNGWQPLVQWCDGNDTSFRSNAIVSFAIPNHLNRKAQIRPIMIFLARLPTWRPSASSGLYPLVSRLLCWQLAQREQVNITTTTKQPLPKKTKLLQSKKKKEVKIFAKTPFPTHFNWPAWQQLVLSNYRTNQPRRLILFFKVSNNNFEEVSSRSPLLLVNWAN